MKLGILCTMTNGFGRRGFYNTQELGLARALVRQGNSVIVYKGLAWKKGTRKERVEVEPGLTVLYLPLPHLGAHGYIRTEVLDKKLDGLLCFADNQVFLPHVFRFCRKHGIVFVPYIGGAHSYSRGFREKVMNRWFALGTLKIFQSVPVIAKTREAERELAALGVPDIRIARVGLDEAVLKKDFRAYDRDEVRRSLGYGPDEVVLCTVARFDTDKRPADMADILKAIRGKKNFRLLWVGLGPLRSEVEAKLEEFGLTELVQILDRVPYEKMWEIYYASDYYLNISRKEIFGMAVMEAIYYETSVAAADAPGPRTILKDMPGHCLCHDDMEIADWLTRNPPSPEELALSSERVIREFGWRQCAETFAAIVSKTRESMEKKNK